MTERKMNEKLVLRYGRTLKQMLRDPSFNVGPALEWLKRTHSNLPRREYGRAVALIDRMLLNGD